MIELVGHGDIVNRQIGVMDAYASDVSDIMPLLLLQLPLRPPTVQSNLHSTTIIITFSTISQSSQYSKWFQDL